MARDGRTSPAPIYSISIQKMGYTLPHAEAKPPKLNPENIPLQFHHLILIAEKYGVSDDGYRDALIESLGENELRECASFLESYDAVLAEWLAGPDADGPTFTNEYVVFSALGMAADCAKLRLEKEFPET
jgi:hypothetical protein